MAVFIVCITLRSRGRGVFMLWVPFRGKSGRHVVMLRATSNHSALHAHAEAGRQCGRRAGRDSRGQVQTHRGQSRSLPRQGKGLNERMNDTLSLAYTLTLTPPQGDQERRVLPRRRVRGPGRQSGAWHHTVRARARVCLRESARVGVRACVRVRVRACVRICD